MTGKWLTGPRHRLTRFGEQPLYREGLYQVSPRGYAWLVPNGSWGETNIGLLDCAGQSVLIDTCWDLRFTNEMLDATRVVTESSPISHVINTHGDGDHCWGNQLFPECTITASQACVDHIHHTTPGAMTTLKQAGRICSHMPPGSLRDFGRYMGGMLAPYDFRGIKISAPTQTFRQETVLRVNGVELILLEVGPAHTDGDIIVFVPEQRLAYTGDIVFAGSTPVTWAGPVGNITRALRRLLTLEADVLVPGHGPLATPRLVQQQIDYWEFLQDSLHPASQRGDPPQVAAQEWLSSARFKASPFAAWGSQERAVSSAFTLYRHWGAPVPSLPGKLGILNILRHQAVAAMAMPGASPAIMHRRN